MSVRVTSLSSEVSLYTERYSDCKKLAWSWTSDASGSYAEKTTLEGQDYTIVGVIELISIIPDQTSPPTNGYNVEISTDSGIDVLRGYGSNMPNNDTMVFYNINMPVLSPLTLTVSGAGNTTKGSVEVYYR